MGNKKKKKIRGTGGGSDNISNGASIPEDIIINILPMLPVKSVSRFRCVCKSWNNLFKTINFAKLQLDYSMKNRNEGIQIHSCRRISYLDYESLSSDRSKFNSKLVHFAYPLQYKNLESFGSCNGLVCYRSFQNDIIIFNPITKAYKKIPPPPEPRGRQKSWNQCMHAHGFSYDSKTEDYKLVMYCMEIYIDMNVLVYVYSLKLNSWRTVENTPFEVPSRNLVFFEGFFHWVQYRGLKEMSCLDIDNETVKHILLPEHFPLKCDLVQVCLLGGSLCVIGIDREKNFSEVWKMSDYGVADSWTKLFTIEGGKLLQLQHLDMKQHFKNDAILVHHGDASTYLYDLNHEVATEIYKIDGISLVFRTWAFFGSLVSPNLGTYLGRQ